MPDMPNYVSIMQADTWVTKNICMCLIHYMDVFFIYIPLPVVDLESSVVAVQL